MVVVFHSLGLTIDMVMPRGIAIGKRVDDAVVDVGNIWRRRPGCSRARPRRLRPFIRTEAAVAGRGKALLRG